MAILGILLVFSAFSTKSIAESFSGPAVECVFYHDKYSDFDYKVTVYTLASNRDWGAIPGYDQDTEPLSRRIIVYTTQALVEDVSSYGFLSILDANDEGVFEGNMRVEFGSVSSDVEINFKAPSMTIRHPKGQIEVRSGSCKIIKKNIVLDRN